MDTLPFVNLKILMNVEGLLYTAKDRETFINVVTNLVDGDIIRRRSVGELPIIVH